MLLTSSGQDPVDVARRVRRGEWLRLERGVFVRRDDWEPLDDRQRHVLTGRARLAVLGPGWALARRTVVAAYDLHHLGREWPSVPQLLGAKGRAKARSRHERIATLPDEQVVLLDGVRATSLERTVVDISRRESFRGAVVIADSAFRAGADPVVASAIGRWCEAWPGGSQVPAVLGFADGRAETALESVSRVAMRWNDLPLPEPQVEVWLGSRLLGRVDFFWRRYNLVGECDGMVKYGDPDVLVKEKLRAEGLTSHGLELVRWNWDHAWRDRGRVMAERIEHGLRVGPAKVLDPRLRFVSTAVSVRFPAAG